MLVMTPTRLLCTYESGHRCRSHQQLHPLAPHRPSTPGTAALLAVLRVCGETRLRVLLSRCSGVPVLAATAAGSGAHQTELCGRQWMPHTQQHATGL